MRGSRGEDRRSGPLLKNHKNIGFLGNTGQDPQKITKLPSQHSMLGHQQQASKTSLKMEFRWRANDGSLKKLSNLGEKDAPPLTKISESVHAMLVNSLPPGKIFTPLVIC